MQKSENGATNIHGSYSLVADSLLNFFLQNSGVDCLDGLGGLSSLVVRFHFFKKKLDYIVVGRLASPNQLYIVD